MFIKVRAKTAQRKESIQRIAVDRFEISVKEKPELNAANHRIVAILAEEMNVSVKQVRFISGQRSPAKLFEIYED